MDRQLFVLSDNVSATQTLQRIGFESRKFSVTFKEKQSRIWVDVLELRNQEQCVMVKGGEMIETAEDLKSRGWVLWDCWDDDVIVATHGDYVCCVGVNEATANQFSGGCWAVQGGDGQITLRNRSKSGWGREMVRIKLPFFQPNPGKTTWHLEHRGRIVAKGRSMATIVRRVEEHAAPQKAGDVIAVPCKGIEIIGKPTVAARKCLKKLGFYWHYKEKIWYAPFTDERLAQAQKILG